MAIREDRVVLCEDFNDIGVTDRRDTGIIHDLLESLVPRYFRRSSSLGFFFGVVVLWWLLGLLGVLGATSSASCVSRIVLEIILAVFGKCLYKRSKSCY